VVFPFSLLSHVYNKYYSCIHDFFIIFARHTFVFYFWLWCMSSWNFCGYYCELIIALTIIWNFIRNNSRTVAIMVCDKSFRSLEMHYIFYVIIFLILQSANAVAIKKYHVSYLYGTVTIVCVTKKLLYQIVPK